MSDEHDLSDRGTGRARALAPESSPQSAANAIDLAAIRAQLDAQASSATWWRWAGGIAASLALTIAASALRLGATASADHDIVGRHEIVLRERGLQDARLLEQSARATVVIEEMRSSLTELRADVRELRAETRRMTEERHR